MIGEAEALEWVLREKKMAFRSHVRTSELAVGDRVAIYASRGCWHNPTRDRAQLAAVGVIRTSISQGSIDVGPETMPAWCDLSLTACLPSRQGLEFAPLTPRLSFINNKQAWGASLRRTIVRVPEKDLDLMEKALTSEAAKRA